MFASFLIYVSKCMCAGRGGARNEGGGTDLINQYNKVKLYNKMFRLLLNKDMILKWVFAYICIYISIGKGGTFVI